MVPIKARLLRLGSVIAGVLMAAPTSWIIYETIKDPYMEWILSISGFIGMAWIVIANLMQEPKND